MNRLTALILWIFGVALWLLPAVSTGQETAADTSVWLSPLSVVSSYPILTGTDTISLRNTYSQSLAEILRTRHNVYFKDYGPGSSSTISMNGGKANEVLLLWDGIPVSNPMLGVNDFSMITGSDQYRLRVADVSSSSVLGAGAIAGAILLDPADIQKNSRLTASLGGSTMNQIQGQLSYSGGTDRYRHHTSVAGLKAKNDFRYQKTNGDETRMPHARTSYWDARHHSRLRLSDRTSISGSIWGREQFREIPPTLTQARSRAIQDDRFLRNVITLRHSGPFHIIHLKGYYGIQDQLYEDPDIKLSARHRFQNAQIKLDNQWLLSSRFSVKYGLHENYYTSRSDNYDEVKQQHRISGYAQVNRGNANHSQEWSLLLKPEKVSGQTADWTGSFQWHLRMPRLGQWTLHTSRNISWPTLNDLYWDPGGNPDLKPEKNWWVGVNHSRKWQQGIKSEIKIYHRRAENWIQWIPSRGGIWRPENHHKARIYGLNAMISKSFGTRVSLTGRYQMVRTFFPDRSPDKLQAIYTPVHMGTAVLLYHISPSLSAELYGEYTSARYTLQDHSERLDPYFLLHPGLSYRSKSAPWQLRISLKNLLNKQYQGIKNRPMPGRIIEINTQYQF